MAAWRPYCISDQVQNRTWSSSNVQINGQNLKSIAPMFLEILSGYENPRRPPGSHIGFPIWSKIELDLNLIYQYTCWLSNQLLKHFLRYWAEMKIQDGRLVAILDFRHVFYGHNVQNHKTVFFIGNDAWPLWNIPNIKKLLKNYIFKII